MKRLLALLIVCIMFVTGCASVTPGINVGEATNVATDVAFVLFLQNNPSYKPVVISELNTVKLYLSNNVTYDDLILFISKQFGGKYAVVGVVLSSYIQTDKPIFETYLPMLGSYKEAIAAKIDKFLMLAKTL